MNERNHQLPCHEFKQTIGGVVDFEIISYDQMSATSRSMSLTDQPHRHAFYEILYYTAGEGTHFIDFTAYPFRPPVLYFISPGQVHFWDRMETGRGYVLLFTENFLLNAAPESNLFNELAFFNDTLEKPELQLTTTQQADIESTIHTIHTEYTVDKFGRTALLRSYLRILLVQIQRMYASVDVSKETSAELSLVRRFKRLISASNSYRRSIRFYADRLGVGVASLNKTVKAVTGQPSGQLIRQEIALEAKRLLVHTEMSAAEIGYQLGFEDPSYFGRFFKRETGLRPSHFRRQTQKMYHLFPG